MKSIFSTSLGIDNPPFDPAALEVCTTACPEGLNQFEYTSTRLLRALNLVDDDEMDIFAADSNSTVECLDNEDCAVGQSCSCSEEENDGFLPVAKGHVKGDAMCMCI